MRYRINGCPRTLVAAAMAGCILITASCTRTKEGDARPSLPADFVTFYDQFHSDSRYQLEHVVFPLQRDTSRIDRDSAAYWTEANWVLHRHFMNDGNYTVEYDVLTEDLVLETIRRKDAPVAMQRTFARLADGWNLIRYREMGPYRSEPSVE